MRSKSLLLVGVLVISILFATGCGKKDDKKKTSALEQNEMYELEESEDLPILSNDGEEIQVDEEKELKEEPIEDDFEDDFEEDFEEPIEDDFEEPIEEEEEDLDDDPIELPFVPVDEL